MTQLTAWWRRRSRETKAILGLAALVAVVAIVTSPSRSAPSAGLTADAPEPSPSATALTSTETPATPSQTASVVSTQPPSACDADFAAAVAIDEMSDSVSDFFPAVRDCATLAEWATTFDAYDGAGFIGTATEVLGNMCLDAEIANEPLCQAVGAEPVPEVTATPKPNPTPKPTYQALTSRTWAQLVKAPDNYIGDHYKLWGCITQFDAATGLDSFRAEASYRNEDYWFIDSQNSFFTGDADRLAEFVTDDVVFMNVEVLGSFSYDTQAGGNTTVPLFQVNVISRRGSC